MFSLVKAWASILYTHAHAPTHTQLTGSREGQRWGRIRWGNTAEKIAGSFLQCMIRLQCWSTSSQCVPFFCPALIKASGRPLSVIPGWCHPILPNIFLSFFLSFLPDCWQNHFRWSVMASLLFKSHLSQWRGLWLYSLRALSCPPSSDTEDSYLFIFSQVFSVTHSPVVLHKRRHPPLLALH